MSHNKALNENKKLMQKESVDVLDLQRQITELRETVEHMKVENKYMSDNIRYLFAVVGRSPLRM